MTHLRLDLALMRALCPHVGSASHTHGPEPLHYESRAPIAQVALKHVRQENGVWPDGGGDQSPGKPYSRRRRFAPAPKAAKGSARAWRLERQRFGLPHRRTRQTNWHQCFQVSTLARAIVCSGSPPALRSAQRSWGGMPPATRCQVGSPQGALTLSLRGRETGTASTWMSGPRLPVP